MKKDGREDVLEALLYAAAKNAGENEREIYEKVSPEQVMTENEQKRIICRTRYPHSAKNRAIIIMKRVAVVVLVIFSCAMSVKSVREFFWQTILEMGTYRTTIRYTAQEGEILPDAIAEFREPFPGELYERHEIGLSKFKYHIEYKADDVTVIYNQSLLKDYEFTVVERYYAGTPDTEKIRISGCDGVRILVGDMVYLNWHDNVYVYSLSGNTTVEELIRIAETLK